MTGPYQQQYPQQPQYPQAQPQGPSNGQPAIALTTKFMVLAWIFFFIKPKVFVNGHQVPAVWGRNVIPVQPGQHQLHVHVPYFLPSKVGPADLTVPIQPGQPPVELEYRAPLWMFSRGSLGPPPQKYNGMGLMLGVMGGLIGIICLCSCISIVASA